MDPASDQRNILLSDIAPNRNLQQHSKHTPEISSWEVESYNVSHQGPTQRDSSQYYGYQERDIQEPSPERQAPVGGIFMKLARLESETWLVEILSMLVSLLAAALIVYYLRRYDGNPHPDLPESITLNALLSVGITIMVATLGVPISSGMGQLNWIRAKSRPIVLSKMDTVDQASRGVWGSVLVIFGWDGGPLGALGGLTFILALAVAPLAQQSILLLNERAIVDTEQPFITRCNGTTGFAGDGMRQSYDGEGNSQASRKSTGNSVPSSMKGEYYNSLYNNFHETIYSDDFAVCNTGNCTWPLFSTLTLCSECKNVTADLVSSKFESGNTEGLEQFSLPGEERLLWPAVRYNILNTNRSEMVHSSHATSMRFAAGQYVTDEGMSKSRVDAWECALSFCVQVIEASIENGLLKENIKEKYNFDDSSIKEMSDHMTLHPPVPASPNNPFTKPIPMDFTDPIFLAGLQTFEGAYGPTATPDDETKLLYERGLGNLTITMDNMARSMGRALRVYCAEAHPEALRVNGEAFVPTVIVRIRWYWLTVPFLVEALALVFFISIVALNFKSGARLWKSSFLAVAIHGLKLQQNPGQHVSLENVHEMDALASVKVKLQDDQSDNGGRSRLVY